MPFGKHKGKRVEEIPLGYLEWVLANCEHASPYLRAEITRVLNADAQPSASLCIPSLTKKWYRQLAGEFHPDRGGSHEAMKAVNRANELLLDMVGAAS